MVRKKMSTRYDRQERLWGPEVQKQLGERNVLLLNLDCVNVEVARLLTSTGVGVTLCDPRSVDKASCNLSFYLELVQARRQTKEQANVSTVITKDVSGSGTVADACLSVLNSFNPDGKIKVARNIQDDIKKYDAISVTCADDIQLSRLFEKCVAEKVRFYGVEYSAGKYSSISKPTQGYRGIIRNNPFGKKKPTINDSSEYEGCSWSRL
jgi:molybdopterin/thiamine biosynthesis adenylyltransferase